MSSQIRSNRKLTLNRETVSNLTAIKESMLALVIGGRPMNDTGSTHINQQSGGTCCCSKGCDGGSGGRF